MENAPLLKYQCTSHTSLFQKDLGLEPITRPDSRLKLLATAYVYSKTIQNPETAESLAQRLRPIFSFRDTNLSQILSLAGGLAQDTCVNIHFIVLRNTFGEIFPLILDRRERNSVWITFPENHYAGFHVSHYQALRFVEETLMTIACPLHTQSSVEDQQMALRNRLALNEDWVGCNIATCAALPTPGQVSPAQFRRLAIFNFRMPKQFNISTFPGLWRREPPRITNESGGNILACLPRVAFTGMYEDLVGAQKIPTLNLLKLAHRDHVHDISEFSNADKFLSTNDVYDIPGCPRTPFRDTDPHTIGAARRDHAHTPGEVGLTSPFAISGNSSDLYFETPLPSTPGDLGAANVSHTHNLTDIAHLSPVAISNHFRDLLGAPKIEISLDDLDASPEDHTHNICEIPGLHKFVLSGSYNDLENKPLIPKYASQIGAASFDHVHLKEHFIGASDVAYSGKYEDVIGRPTYGTAALLSVTDEMEYTRDGDIMTNNDYRISAMAVLGENGSNPGDIENLMAIRVPRRIIPVDLTAHSFSNGQAVPAQISNVGLLLDMDFTLPDQYDFDLQKSGLPRVLSVRDMANDYTFIAEDEMTFMKYRGNSTHPCPVICAHHLVCQLPRPRPFTPRSSIMMTGIILPNENPFEIVCMGKLSSHIYSFKVEPSGRVVGTGLVLEVGESYSLLINIGQGVYALNNNTSIATFGALPSVTSTDDMYDISIFGGGMQISRLVWYLAYPSTPSSDILRSFQMHTHRSITTPLPMLPVPVLAWVDARRFSNPPSFQSSTRLSGQVGEMFFKSDISWNPGPEPHFELLTETRLGVRLPEPIGNMSLVLIVRPYTSSIGLVTLSTFDSREKIELIGDLHEAVIRISGIKAESSVDRLGFPLVGIDRVAFIHLSIFNGTLMVSNGTNSTTIPIPSEFTFNQVAIMGGTPALLYECFMTSERINFAEYFRFMNNKWAIVDYPLRIPRFTIPGKPLADYKCVPYFAWSETIQRGPRRMPIRRWPDTSTFNSPAGLVSYAGYIHFVFATHYYILIPAGESIRGRLVRHARMTRMQMSWKLCLRSTSNVTEILNVSYGFIIVTTHPSTREHSIVVKVSSMGNTSGITMEVDVDTFFELNVLVDPVERLLSMNGSERYLGDTPYILGDNIEIFSGASPIKIRHLEISQI